MTGDWITGRRAVLGWAGGAIAAPLTATAATAADAGETSATLVLDTTEAAMRAPIGDAVEHLVTRGFARIGDGGGATWRRVAAPAHPTPIRDRSGRAFEIADPVIRPEMFGAHGGDADDQAAIQAAVTLATRTGRRLELSGPRYSHRGEIVIGGGVHRFSIVGAGTSDLVQLQSGRAHFVFAGENTSHWTISGLRFMWAADQTAADRNAYAVRFESDDPDGIAGHYNFEISNCILWNGFRGFGQRDDGAARPRCPVWGGSFERISALSLCTGAAIYLRTWGRAGQPNNRVRGLYARCDKMSEPAIILEANDGTLLTSIEFNNGTGCQLSVASSPNVSVIGMRFEHVALGSDDCLIRGAGSSTALHLSGVSVQSTRLLAPPGRRAIVEASGGARVALDHFADVAWRAPDVPREDGASAALALARTVSGGRVAIGPTGLLVDPALIFARPGEDEGVSFTAGRSYPLIREGEGTPVVAEEAGVAVALLVRAVGPAAGARLRLGPLVNGKAIADMAVDPARARWQRIFLPRGAGGGAGMRVRPGDMLSIRIRAPSRAAPPPDVSFALLVSSL